MASISLSKISKDIQQLSNDLGIDLSKYGNASPVKLMLKSLELASRTIQDTFLTLNNEQNPITATHFKSRLGLATVQSLQPTKLLQGSSGKIMVDPKNRVIRVNQYSKLTDDKGHDFYVVLPTESVIINEPTELVIKQGTRTSITETLTGEKWQAIDLDSKNYVDSYSIDVHLNGRRLKIGFNLDEEADCYVTMSDNAVTQIVLDKNLEVTAGESLVIDYAECIGVYGDNIETGTYMSGSKFAFSGDDDVTKDCEIYISMPIIGGTDFDNFDVDLAQEIRYAGKNNLIGTQKQMMQYVNRFKQYIVQISKLNDGVLTLTCYRNIRFQLLDKDYWEAIQELMMTQDDIRSLREHLNALGSKSLELVVDVDAAKIAQCIATVYIKSPKNQSIDANVVAAAVADYAVTDMNTRNYEIGKLYRAVLNAYELDDFRCEIHPLSGTSEELCHVNEFGTIEPNNVDTILVLGYLDVYIDGELTQFGAYA